MAIITFFPLVVTTILTSILCFTSALTSTFFLSPNQSKTWTNNDDSVSQTIQFTDHSLARFILLREQSVNLQTGLCFHCSSYAQDSCFLRMIMVESYGANSTIVEEPPQIVWSANRHSPVERNATLELYSGGLVLKNANGNTVWESPAVSKPIRGLTISGQGNMALSDQSNETVWQSFDNPTDTLLIGQTLREEQCLTYGKSSANANLPMFRLCVYNLSLTGFVEVERSTQYLSIAPFTSGFQGSRLLNVTVNPNNVSFVYQTPDHSKISVASYAIKSSMKSRFLKLDSDGGVKMYSWDSGFRWQAKSLLFLSYGVGDCQFPLKCGRYGVCGSTGQCSCPVALNGGEYFKFSDSQLPYRGCSQINSLSLETSSHGSELVSFGSLSYFSYVDPGAAIPEVDTEESCKQTCLNEESCKAAFFKFRGNGSQGDCYLPSEILSIINDTSYVGSTLHNTSSYIKVLKSRPAPASYSRKFILIISILLLFIFALWLFLKWKNRNWEVSPGCLEKLSSSVRKFSYDELCLATGNFAEQLGGGGFGMVFKGVLEDGTLVAVKRLDKVGQGMKEFLAEVETVGNIHHVNVVKLIGICIQKRQKMLVYEYMSNGSLEKWIFDDSKSISFDWKMRKKILLDISKGLAYLHEDCRQQIAHLDVKPDNILLDESFNAKLSDFGMSKLIKRDESRVMTGIRGTIGYLAPEWQKSGITVKADIYSFGIVVLEVISGRKNLDYSLPESDVHLLSLLQEKALENRLMDIIDHRSGEMQCHSEEVLQLIRLGIWCLDKDYKRRPSMSLVVKVLEGVTELKDNISCNLPFVATPPPSGSTLSSSQLRASKLHQKIFPHIMS